MAKVDLARVQRRARFAYERARLQRALVGFAPALVICAAAACLGTRPSEIVAFGVAAFLAGVALLWYGREPRRAVLPGFVAGLLPLALTIAAMRAGHMCFGDRCSTWCLWSCVVGGALAGFAVGHFGFRRGYGVRYLLAASAIAVLTGSMGGTCMGLSGLYGLVLGYLGGVAPAAVARWLVARGAR